ncbi:DNA mismatch endonuclease Vsr [Pedobacter sp. UYEF25]
MSSKLYLPKERNRTKVPSFEEEAGFYTSKARSAVMAKIKAKDTIQELRFRNALWANNVLYRTHMNHILGKLDFVINKYRLVIFVDGDFLAWLRLGRTEAKNQNERYFLDPKN